MGRKLILVLLVLILTACGGSASPTSATVEERQSFDSETSAGAASAPEAPAAAPADGADLSQEQEAVVNGARLQANQSAQPGAQRLVIRTATLRALVQDVGAAEASVRQLAESREGFVLSSATSGEDDNRTATISFKVPAARFDETLAEVSKLALKVDSLRVEGQDVTDEFVDLESRLRNLRAVETRLLQFLTDANRTEDALAVNEQLSDIQGQIEEAQGRIAYLQQSAALSTITVDLYAQAIVSVLPQPGWVPSATARAALNNLIGFGQAIANVAIVVAIWVPVWLPLLLLALWMRRRMRRPTRPAPTPDPGATQP